MGRYVASKDRSLRQLRVGEILRIALVEIFQEEHFIDPVLSSTTIIVTEVQISPNLSSATAFVYPLGGENQELLLESLYRACGFFRSRLADKVTLKYLPSLEFKLETVFDKADAMSLLLKQTYVSENKESDEE